MLMKIEDIQMEDRFREDFGDIEDLAKSIEKHGLIQPPVVTSEGLLVAGERRTRACIELGLKEIEVRLIDDLSELERREMELEENIARKQFTWQEEVRAKEEIHRIKQESHGARVKGHESEGWGVKDTADVLDESVGGVSQDIKLARALQQYPELLEAENKYQAMKLLKKLQEQEIIQELAETVEERTKGDLYEIVNDNCITWMREQPDESFDVAIVDPPWGIDMDTKSQMSRERDVQYGDGLEEAYMTTFMAMEELYRILKPNSHLYLYFGITNKELIEDLIVDLGFEYDAVPLIWNKDHGGSAAKGRTYPKAYESIYFCYKGKRDIRTGDHNVFTIKRPSNNSRIHSAQKPIELEERFICNSTKPGERVIVPFAGSGAAVIAAVRAGREVVGIEKDKENFVLMDDFIRQTLAEDVVDHLKEG